MKKLELFEAPAEFLSFRKWAYFDRRKSQVLIFCFFFIKEKEKKIIYLYYANLELEVKRHLVKSLIYFLSSNLSLKKKLLVLASSS